jgi:NitT/TauT family transport system substrate-binding protein
MTEDSVAHRPTDGMRGARGSRARRPSGRLAAAASTVAATLLLAACGGDEASTADPGASAPEGAPVALDVTSIPIVDTAPYFWALDEGVFEEHDLTVTDHVSQGGAAGIPGVLSGDFDIAFSNVVSAALARQRGLPVKLVLGGDNSTAPPDKDPAALLVAPNSPIKSAKDLVGKTVGVNALNNIDHLFVAAWLDSEGVDPASVKLVEVPFPEHVTALLRGRVDAVQTATPFQEELIGEGAKVLAFPHQAKPGAPIAGYVTSEKVLEENGEAIERFRAAMEQAAEEVLDPANEERLFEILSKRTQVDVGILENVVFPDFDMTIDPAGMAQIVEYADEFGILENPIEDVDGFVADLLAQG